jgi:3-deoxy-D-manno-octulosonate 8-phosphate phosphatase (KDO 8-P phosphatase)
MIVALRAVRLVITDVDGVLTSGLIPMDGAGRRMGFFSARDGMGATLAHQAGLHVAILSGARSEALRARAQDLGIRWVREGESDKASGVRALCVAAGCDPQECLYLGDDLNDIPAFRTAGVAVAVADAVPELRALAHWVTHATGGAGAFREVVDTVLRAQGTWERTVTELFGPAAGAREP